MKNFINFPLVLIFLVILNSCSKDESTQELSTETITLEDGLDINYEDLTVLTFDEESDVDENGNFNIEISINEELPILFLKDNEIIFGYYEKTGNDNTLSVDDILLFYFSMHPEIVKQGINNVLLKQHIKSNSSYNKLKNLVKVSLGENNSPFKDENFVSILNKSGYEIGISTRTDKRNNLKKNNYTYTFTRDGMIQWEKDFPVYCTVGLEVVGLQSNESVSGTHVLEKSGLVLSPSSGIKWLYDYFKTDEFDSTGKFSLPSDGEYQINLSNGVDNFGTKVFEQKIDEINRIDLGIDIVSFMIPIGIERVLGKADCRDAIVSFFKDVSLKSLKAVFYLNGNLNKIEAEKELFDISNDIYDQIVKCALGGKSIKFIDAIKDIGDKYFNKVEDGASIALFIRDYVVSDIKSSEIRYFYDGISFGKLSQQNLSGMEYINEDGNTEFRGQENSDYIYVTKIKEEVVTHNIERGLRSTINSVVKEELAIGIPFEIKNNNNGDATLVEVDKIIETRVDGTVIGETKINGTLQVKFKMGNDKNTQFEIMPAFEAKGQIDRELVDLIFEDPLLGIWEAISHNGVPMGQAEIRTFAKAGFSPGPCNSLTYEELREDVFRLTVSEETNEYYFSSQSTKYIYETDENIIGECKKKFIRKANPNTESGTGEFFFESPGILYEVFESEKYYSTYNFIDNNTLRLTSDGTTYIMERQ